MGDVTTLPQLAMDLVLMTGNVALVFTTDQSWQRIGNVEGWCEVIDVASELISFRWTYTFEATGAIISSESTLRLWERQAIESSLNET